MPRILGRLQAAACLGDDVHVTDLVKRWRMHESLPREASRVVRDKSELAGAAVARLA